MQAQKYDSVDRCFFSGSFFFAFPTNQIARQVIQHMPPVGIGANYGLPRTRYKLGDWYKLYLLLIISYPFSDHSKDNFLPALS